MTSFPNTEKFIVASKLYRIIQKVRASMDTMYISTDVLIDKRVT